MKAVRLSRITGITLGSSIALATAVASAWAETSVKAIFEKYGLLGTYALDCTNPPSKENAYWIQRVIDDGTVQRDLMSGKTSREYIQYIDKATEAKPNEIAIGLTRDDKSANKIWRIERKTGDDVRYLVVEVSSDGKKSVSGGRYVGGGGEVPWLNKCGK